LGGFCGEIRFDCQGFVGVVCDGAVDAHLVIGEDGAEDLGGFEVAEVEVGEVEGLGGGEEDELDHADAGEDGGVAEVVGEDGEGGVEREGCCEAAVARLDAQHGLELAAEGGHGWDAG
jgi:hypothetical protein